MGHAGTETAGMSTLFGRAILAFLALPGVVAFVVPWLILTSDQRRQFVDVRGLIPLSLGIVLLLWCVWTFYAAGKGTLAPWSPPRYLVTGGLFRFSRNPMYIAVTMILCGWAWGFRSRAVFIYAVLLMLAFHVRVVFYEEPWLARAHGDTWQSYKARTPRWIGLRDTTHR